MNKFIIASMLCAALAGVSGTAGATTVTITDPGYGPEYVWSYTNPSAGEPQTHILGIYESRNDHSGSDNHPMGTTYVNVTGSSSAPINLVLSSYEPTKWVLTGEGVSSIGQVLVNGYEKSLVEGISAALVTDKTGIGNYVAACAFMWPRDTGGCNTPGLVSGVEAHFGTPITSFTGAYRANHFEMNISAVPEAGVASYLLAGLMCLGSFAIRRSSRQ
ncbi:MAG: hypothetical protein QM742_17635 [Aquabacterium sp.]